MRLSNAKLGVWFNGSDVMYLEKKMSKKGPLFYEIPNIPPYGKSVNDIGKYLRKDLVASGNLLPIFKAIRNHLAANAKKITRDEEIAKEIIKILFCKIYDEKYTKPDGMVRFRTQYEENSLDVKNRIQSIFDDVKNEYPDVIADSESIKLDNAALQHTVSLLMNLDIGTSSRDVMSEAFELFMGDTFKGQQGQFFTPRNVTKMLVEMMNPGPNDLVIDPACGSGGFLVEVLRHVWGRVEAQGADLNWPESETLNKKYQVATQNIKGIDKDEFLQQITKTYMAILGDGRSGIFCENSLHKPTSWSTKTKSQINLGIFDMVFANPPFGKNLKVKDESVLKQYQLGHKWKDGVKGSVEGKGRYTQFLFIERCLQLLKPGGTLGIVIPESTFGMPSHKYVVDYILKSAQIKAVISMPENLFQPHTHARTCVVIMRKLLENEEIGDYDIFMSQIKWCGHDSRGSPTYQEIKGEMKLMDDIPRIPELYREFLASITGEDK